MAGRAHFDTILMIVSGRVVPYAKPDENVVVLPQTANHLDRLYDALAAMLQRSVYTEELPSALCVCAPYFKHVYPEFDRHLDYPLIYEDFAQWRGQFIAEHDLPEWYDLPILDIEGLEGRPLLGGDQVCFIEPDGSKTKVYMEN